MATGRSNKLVGQTGEYLAAAELSRRGLIATTFTGNVPHFDIIASDENGKCVSVQVKTSSGSSWQFANMEQYCEIKLDGKRQVVGKPKRCPLVKLIMVFVKIEDSGGDRFYILTWEDLRDLLIDHHKDYLAKHDGIRPKKWDSLHCAISEAELLRCQNNWPIIHESLR